MIVESNETKDKDSSYSRGEMTELFIGQKRKKKKKKELFLH